MKLHYKNHSLDLSTPQIMGILNVTPDSFSDGGQFSRLDNALRHAEKMIEAGATLIDVGGESTRPGADEVPLEQELSRVIPVIKALKQHTDVWISLDTSKADAMAQGIDAGVSLINDVRALREPNALEVVAKANIPVCLMHMKGEPKTMQSQISDGDIVQQVSQFLSDRVEVCLDAGIDKKNILLDPGFGFAKSLEQNYHLLANLDALKKLNYPLLIGLSRKGMLYRVLGRPADEMQTASVTGAILAAQRGANIIRVHDVEATKDALTILNMMQQNV